MFDLIFVKPLANALFIIYGLIPGHDFGVALIILTVLLRLLLWPVLSKQLQSQKKMQALQPEIAKLKEKSKGDKQLESQLLMELYKEKEINPLASCLPLLIQLPFLIGLFAVFTHATQGVAGFEKYLYDWTKGLPQIALIIENPSAFHATLFGIVDLAAKRNIFLAILAAGSQYIQVKQISPKVVDKSDPNAAASQMMTWLFPLLTGWIGYTLVAALPLYWTVSNLVSIGQQALIMGGEVEKMEEATVVTTVRHAGETDTKALKSPKKPKGGKRKK